jgi:hypothetical protein
MRSQPEKTWIKFLQRGVLRDCKSLRDMPFASVISFESHGWGIAEFII